MEQTFDHDIQEKKCYIYDFYHDDQPDKNQNMTYDNTTKTPIDAKFIINSYQSIDKDQVPYYLQFRPYQKYSFSENDDLYYYETDYHERYLADFPIGLYIAPYIGNNMRKLFELLENPKAILTTT